MPDLDGLFRGWTIERGVWGRNGREAEMHIFGPQLPRWAPISPMHVAPCGEILYSNSVSDTVRGRIPDDVCGRCAGFARSRAAGLV